MIYELKNCLPGWTERAVIRIWYLMRPAVRIACAGRAHRCPVCETSVRQFLPHKLTSMRRRIVCPVCLSHPRHRMAWICLRMRTPLFDGVPKLLLHFAPETEFARRFRSAPSIRYMSVDLDSPHAMARMDITALTLPDCSVDAIYCSHVLEHVAADRTAMREMHRVLKPGGWAAVQVPLGSGPTNEDPSITDRRQRTRLFGQHDHVRRYGPDVRERLAEAGFDVMTVRGRDLESPEMCTLHGFSPDEVVFLCTRPAVATGRSQGP